MPCHFSFVISFSIQTTCQTSGRVFPVIGRASPGTPTGAITHGSKTSTGSLSTGSPKPHPSLRINGARGPTPTPLQLQRLLQKEFQELLICSSAPGALCQIRSPLCLSSGSLIVIITTHRSPSVGGFHAKLKIRRGAPETIWKDVTL